MHNNVGGGGGGGLIDCKILSKLYYSLAGVFRAIFQLLI